MKISGAASYHEAHDMILTPLEQQSVDYALNELRNILAESRSQGDCPVYSLSVPEPGTARYDELKQMGWDLSTQTVAIHVWQKDYNQLMGIIYPETEKEKEWILDIHEYFNYRAYDYIVFMV